MSSNILLVDDSKTIRTHVRSILQHAEDDYQVVDYLVQLLRASKKLLYAIVVVRSLREIDRRSKIDTTRTRTSARPSACGLTMAARCGQTDWLTN